MAELKLQRLGDKHLSLNKFPRNKRIESVFIPDGWWSSYSTFDFITEKEPAPIFKLDPPKSPSRMIESLPQTKYWKIRQGDYRSKADRSKLTYNKKQKKIIDLITLFSAIIITTAITLAVSFIIAKI